MTAFMEQWGAALVVVGILALWVLRALLVPARQRPALPPPRLETDAELERAVAAELKVGREDVLVVRRGSEVWIYIAGNPDDVALAMAARAVGRRMPGIRLRLLKLRTTPAGTPLIHGGS